MPSFSKRFIHALERLIAAMILGTIFSVGFVIIRTIQTADSFSSPVQDDELWWRQVKMSCLELAVWVWCFGVGSAIGSFLNVLVWRWPRGERIGGWSHCPHCRATLSFWENLPILGWLLLGGRCRHCWLPIHPRYLLVELLGGCVLGAVGLCVLYRGRMLLPLMPGPASIPWRIRVTDFQPIDWLWLAYWYTTFGGLMAIGMFRLSGNRIPASIAVITGGCIVLLTLTQPSLQPQPWQFSAPHTALVLKKQTRPWESAPRRRPTWQGISKLDSLAFLLCGAACGMLFAKLLGSIEFPGADLRNHPTSLASGQFFDVSIAWVLSGMLVGWQTFVFAWPLIVALSRFVGRLRQYDDAAGVLLMATPIVLAITIYFWPTLAESQYFPRSGNGAWLYLAYAASGWLMIVLGRRAPKAEPG